MRRLDVRFLFGCLAAIGAFAAAGCGGSGSDNAASTTAADPTTDKLAQVLARGTLVGYHEADYPPQSMDIQGAKRLANTKCAETQLTANQVEGFDADATKLVAKGLGVEACFATPSWTEITAGNWGDRLDIAYGSGSINADRMERLYMTQPYYAVPNYYFVAKSSAARHAHDLDGKRIGSCASCSHEMYLNGDLEIPGVDITLNVKNPKVVTFETEPPGLKATAKGSLDAFLAAEPVGKAQIDAGVPLRQLPEVAFTYYPSGFVDKSSGLSSDGVRGQGRRDRPADSRRTARSRRNPRSGSATTTSRPQRRTTSPRSDRRSNEYSTVELRPARWSSLVARRLRVVGKRQPMRRRRRGRTRRPSPPRAIRRATSSPRCSHGDADPLHRPRVSTAVLRGQGCQAPDDHQVRRESAHRQPDHRLRRRNGEARGQAARGRALLRDALVDRGDGRELGRPLGSRLRVGSRSASTGWTSST